MHDQDHSLRGMLREHAPRSDAAKPGPPSATGVVTYRNRFPSRFEIRVSFWNGYSYAFGMMAFELLSGGSFPFLATPEAVFDGKSALAMPDPTVLRERIDARLLSSP